MKSSPLTQTAARCPKCNRPPAIRFSQLARDAIACEELDEIVSTLKCKCGEIYPITVADVLGDEAEDPAPLRIE